MREINGVKVRGLTRKEVKSLKKYGFYLSEYNPIGLTSEMRDEGIEKACDLCVVDKDAFDKLGDSENNYESTKVFFGIVKETYGAKDEEKNLPSSGDGSQTESV